MWVWSGHSDRGPTRGSAPSRIGYGTSRVSVNRPDTAVPTLNRPELKPLTSPLGFWPIGPVTPVLKKPEPSPFRSEPPVAVFPIPDMKWFSVPPPTVLRKPDTSSPALPKPEFPMPVL
ncbi:hypothetical protein TM48_03854 [Mycobacterium shottsii]|nr:hypothetical protein TM48_03854 [Mycobacterium shottsii]